MNTTHIPPYIFVVLLAALLLGCDDGNAGFVDDDEHREQIEADMAELLDSAAQRQSESSEYIDVARDEVAAALQASETSAELD